MPRTRTRKPALSLSGDPKNTMVFRLDAAGFIEAGGVRIDANGQPRRSYTKEIYRVGAKVRNTAQQVVVLSAELADRIAATFNKMLAANIRVPIQMGHTTSGDHTLGSVVSVWRNGPMLCAEVEMIGTRGIEAASKLDVSVYIEPEHERDGTVYPDALTHLACTPLPQVTGLGAFVPLAASLADRVFSPDPEKEAPTMWKNLAAALSLDVSKLTDDTGPAAVETAVKAMVASNATLAADKNAIAASLKAKTEEASTLQLSVGRLTAEAGGDTQIPADILEEYASLHEQKLDALVASRRISPAQKTKAMALIGAKDNRNALALSKTAAAARGLPNSIAASLIDILTEGAGKSVGRSQTGDQGTPNADDSLSADDTKAFMSEVASQTGFVATASR